MEEWGWIFVSAPVGSYVNDGDSCPNGEISYVILLFTSWTKGLVPCHCRLK